MASAAAANGVLPASALHHRSPTASRESKAQQPRRKLLLRRLPPGLTQPELVAQLGHDWKVGAGKVERMAYCKGKISNDLAKPSRPSRAYFLVTSDSYVYALDKVVRHTNFVDATKSAGDAALVGPPVLEFAPYQKVSEAKNRTDARQGQIDQDVDFMHFLESLTNPIPKPVPLDTRLDGSKDEKITTTPLIEALREKKVNKGKSDARAVKYSRGGSKDLASDKGDKKATKGTAPTHGDKSRRTGKPEKAANDAVKILNREASSSQAKQTPEGSSESKAGDRVTSTPERRRANMSIAKAIIQHDLGLGPSPHRKRPLKRDAPGAQDAAPTELEATPAKQVATDASSSASAETSTKPLSSAKRELSRPSRAERRAQKASLEDKAKAPAPSSNPPTTPVILKKQSSAADGPKSSENQAPKGSATPRTVASGPSASPKLAAALPGCPQQSSRQAFLKHANASQGITEALIHAALKAFGAVDKVEIDRRKGFAYVDFAESDGLQNAIAASPVTVANGAVQVLERRDKPPRKPQASAHAHYPAAAASPVRGRGGGGAGRARGRGGARGGTRAPAHDSAEAGAVASAAPTLAAGAGSQTPSPSMVRSKPVAAP